MIMVSVGTRPEAIKMIPVVNALRQRGEEVRAVCTGQHGDLIRQVEKSFGFKFDLWTKEYRAGLSLSQQVGEVIVGTSNHLEDAQCVCVHGDTATTMGAALAAFMEGVPVAHVNAGMRTYRLDSPFPEEGIRQCVDRLSTWNFASTIREEENLRKEKIDEFRIFVTGNTAIDVLRAYQEEARCPQGYNGTDEFLVLVTCHRRENYPDNMRKLAAILLNLDARVVVVSHPNPKVSKIFNGSGVEVLPPLGYLEMIWMLQKSGMIITDSGGLVEEAAELGVPAVIFREATERIAAVVKGRAVLSLDEDAIAGSLERVKRDEWKRVPSEIFGDGRASGRIADILIDSLRSKP